jgi:hypothetical protein
LFVRTLSVRTAIHFALIALATALPCASAQDQDAVPIEREPRHKLVFQNDQFRIFDTRIAAGDVTLYHTHRADSVFVCIEGGETQSEEAGKPVAKRPPPKRGDLWYREHSKTPLTHRVHNVGQTDYRVLDIEVLAPLATDNGQPVPLPRVYQPVLENDRVRLSRVVLEPQQTTGDDPTPLLRGVLVSVSGGRAIIDTPPNRHSVIEFDPGDYAEREHNGKARVRNGAASPQEFVQIEIK